METEGFYYPSVCDGVCGTQASAAGAVIAGGFLEAALWIVLLIGNRFILGDKNNQRHQCDDCQGRDQFPPPFLLGAYHLRRAINDGRFFFHARQSRRRAWRLPVHRQ